MRRFQGVELSKEKCCLFTRDGGMLWRSPAWGNTKEVPISEIGDFRWLEFVHPEDSEAVLHFFRKSKKTLHDFRAYSIAEKCWVRVWLYKIECDLGWLALGHTEKITIDSTPGFLPGSNCVISGIIALASVAHALPHLIVKKLVQ